MDINDELRIRTLLTDPSKEEVCLSDVIEALMLCSDDLRDLEFKNTAHALRNAKESIRKARAIWIQFETRIKTKVTEEVAHAVSTRDKSVVIGNPEKLAPFKLQKGSNKTIKSSDLNK